MVSVYSLRKGKKADRATDVRITKYFREASPTTKAATFESGSASGTSSSNNPDGHHVTDAGHVSDHDSESSDMSQRSLKMLRVGEMAILA